MVVPARFEIYFETIKIAEHSIMNPGETPSESVSYQAPIYY